MGNIKWGDLICDVSFWKVTIPVMQELVLVLGKLNQQTLN